MIIPQIILNLLQQSILLKHFFLIFALSTAKFNTFAVQLFAQLAELVDALVSNTSEKSCRFDSGTGYLTGKPLIKPYLSGVFGSIKVLQNSDCLFSRSYMFDFGSR